MGNLCTVIGHAGQLQLLFYQLLDNAIKFSPGRPEIAIDCDEIWLEEPTAAFIAERKYWRINVTDSGIGFPAESAEKIFDMFEKLHDKSTYRGSGVGLAVARKIMNAHDGFIKAESGGGKTTFSCFFPQPQ